MNVTFKACPRLLRIGEIDESLLEADDSFRKQVIRIVLSAVRNGDIPLRTKNGFKVSQDGLEYVKRSASLTAQMNAEVRALKHPPFLDIEVRLLQREKELYIQSEAHMQAIARGSRIPSYDARILDLTHKNQYLIESERELHDLDIKIQQDKVHRRYFVQLSELIDWFRNEQGFDVAVATEETLVGDQQSVEMQHAFSTEENNALDRYSQRLMQDGFDNVRQERAGESNFESKVGKVNLSHERCLALARMPELKIAEWVELTGVSTGLHQSYRITAEGVRFRLWTHDDFTARPIDEHVHMHRENETTPLNLPCTPARFMQFIDASPTGSHCFSVPDTFRQEVIEDTKKNNRQQKETEPWMQRACEYADNIYLRELNIGKKFVKESKAGEIAAKLKRDKLVTKTGKPITPDYVVRFGLADWKPPEPD